MCGWHGVFGRLLFAKSTRWCINKMIIFSSRVNAWKPQADLSTKCGALQLQHRIYISFADILHRLLCSIIPIRSKAVCCVCVFMQTFRRNQQHSHTLNKSCFRHFCSDFKHTRAHPFGPIYRKTDDRKKENNTTHSQHVFECWLLAYNCQIWYVLIKRRTEKVPFSISCIDDGILQRRQPSFISENPISFGASVALIRISRNWTDHR